MKKLIKEYREEINNLLIPSMQKHLKVDRIPTLNFIEDEENAKDMFGKTAHYNPNTSEITVYITGRHPKDIMRSVAHEVVHHAQNCRGEFDDAFNLGEEGYAQSNDHLRNMEKEAYLSGNMLFRDWEDNFKKQRNSNTMVNEKALRAKIKAIISEMVANHDENEPTMPHKEDCDCEDCKNQKESLKMKGIRSQGYMAEAIRKAERDAIPLKEWRNNELNSLLMTKFGIVAPHSILGEKRFAGKKELDNDGDGVPKWADKDDHNPKVGSKKSNKRDDRKVSDKTVKKAHEIGKEVEKSGSAKEPYAVGMAVAKKMSKKGKK